MKSELREIDIYELALDYRDNKLTKDELEEIFNAETVAKIVQKADEMKQLEQVIKFSIIKRSLVLLNARYQGAKMAQHLTYGFLQQTEAKLNEVLLTARTIAREQVRMLKQNAWIGVRESDSPTLKKYVDRVIKWGGETIGVISQGTKNWYKVVDGLEKLDPEIVRFFEPVQKEFDELQRTKQIFAKHLDQNAETIVTLRKEQERLQNRLNFRKLALVAGLFENVANSF